MSDPQRPRDIEDDEELKAAWLTWQNELRRHEVTWHIADEQRAAFFAGSMLRDGDGDMAANAREFARASHKAWGSDWCWCQRGSDMTAPRQQREEKTNG